MPATTTTTQSIPINTENITKDIKKSNNGIKPDEYRYPFYSNREAKSDGFLYLKESERIGIKHKEFEPTWDTNDKYPPYEIFEFTDKGIDADPNYSNLLPKINSEELKIKELTPRFGTEIHGIQLSELSETGKDELAHLVAQRGVVVFRDQYLSTKGAQFSVEFASYFGPLHIHPTSGAPKHQPSLHIVYRSEDTNPKDTILNKRISSVRWHSDVSYEKQPPGTTFLVHLEGPETGGDTTLVDTVGAFERLSPEFQQILEGLTAIHSGFEQAEGSLTQGGILRREPVSTRHPIVRTHPITGKKALFINPGFTRDIVELKKEESDAVLGFLYNHLSTSIDLQLRAKWAPGTVVVWDNRRTVHSALHDWDTPKRRHLYRLGPRAEVPSLD